MGRLTAAGVRSALKTPGKYSDGDGLFLLVRGPRAASWIARLQSGGKRREFGLGSADVVGLAQAREKTRVYKREFREGRDPMALTRPPRGLTMTFRDAAYEFLDKKFTVENMRRAKRRMEMYALPRLGRMQIQTIDAALIADTLQPIWTKQPETGRMVRSLITRTLRYARPDGPLFEVTLAKAVYDRLPKQPPRGNRAALHYRHVPNLMDRLQTKTGMGALALRMAILCASRSQEVRGARWSEIDLERREWLIPAARMKMRKVHKLPLSEQALAVLMQAAALRRDDGDLVFPSRKDGWLSDMTLTKALRDLGEAATQHGFRSSFRDWAAEMTSAPDAVAEACLAHEVEDKVVAAYRRTDFFVARRDLLAAWGSFCAGIDGAHVVQLHPNRG
ncbi:MAG: tyrosine-type recombinase/integrase [Sphingomonas sp.]|nr:tyrosine-type recombinase/integrase [Sphingomonas sp.]